MAHLLSCLRRGWRAPPVLFTARTTLPTRNFHATPAALKKKKGTKSDEGEELFATESKDDDSLFGASDDLFSGAGEVNAEAAGGSSVGISKKLSPEKRLAKFSDTLKFVSERIAKNAKARNPQVRNSAWQHLFNLATTEEQMQQVAELFPRWRDARRKFNTKNTELFVRRCEELKCQRLALQVFSDHPKYGFDLSSQKAARRLLHSLHMAHPLADSITLAALLRVYKLPAISSDLVSCAMLTAACFKHGTAQSLAIAREMTPHLQGLLEKTEPAVMAPPQHSAERAKDEGKEKIWLSRTLDKIEKALQEKGQEYDWLHRWREASGHTQFAA